MTNAAKSRKSRVWQKMMIWLACNNIIRRVMQGNPLTARLARRFVGGPDCTTAIHKAGDLGKNKMQTSFYYLGEYVTSPDLVEENVQQIVKAVKAFGEAGAEIFVSVDPTQIGYSVSDELGLENALRIGRVVAEQPTTRFMMIDMEDHTYVDKTIDLFLNLKAQGLPVAITLQTYLYRAEDDFDRLTQEGTAIRLVKGAFVESSEIALTKKADIDAGYLRLAKKMLAPEMREKGVYPIFATHDDAIINELKPLLKAHGWQPDEYEFEFLLGVREKLQQQLRDEGHTMRLYVPFGTEWWPYTIRRIGENPANARFVLQALVGR
jgi:proline dehydrogenase